MAVPSAVPYTTGLFSEVVSNAQIEFLLDGGTSLAEPALR
jgi:hypothetical protein